MVVVASAAFVLVAVREASAGPTCNVTVNTENVAHNAVQSAINSANPGWTICLGSNSFPEQLNVPTKGITLVGAGAASTIIDPPTIALNTVDWDSASPQQPLGAIILVDNTTGVNIKALTVDGTAGASSFSSCADAYAGIDYQNSTGAITSVKVKGIEFAPSLLGCQSQLAIYAYTGWFNTGFVPLPVYKVSIQKTTVTAYGKNGITCDDPGLVCTIGDSTTTGIGGTSVTAQNGIQIAYGAVGHLSFNTVSGDNYTGSGSTLDWYGTGYQASGVLLYNAGSGTTVTHTTVTGCPIPIASFATTAATLFITSNTLSGFEGYGIVANGAPGSSTFIGNNSLNALATGAPGILVDNGTFNVTGNTISHVAKTGTQGASQVVCGTGSYLSCSPTLSIHTAAIQAVSEGSGGATDLTVYRNTFSHDSLSLATLAMPTGSVSVDWV
ncbi:MAG: hypothetical protein L3K23_02970 [Thermoplasmata archaeon]|nr:hypothetical protein [Thermoplasmata archaeon]